jgi:hypothetical protein
LWACAFCWQPRPPKKSFKPCSSTSAFNTITTKYSPLYLQLSVNSQVILIYSLLVISLIPHGHPDYPFQDGKQPIPDIVATKLNVTFPTRCDANCLSEQAATAIQGLKMTESPAKKIDFTVADKENSNIPVKLVGIPELDFTTSTDDKAESNVAATIKDEEKHEILLRENPQRFVLFPIQHHEV